MHLVSSLETRVCTDLSAISVMATFVHNEPTSLAILQELQLPQTLYENLEKKYPTSIDVRSPFLHDLPAQS